MKDQSSYRRPSFWGALSVIVVLCGLYAPPSLAGAIYLGRSTVELTIESLTGGTTVGSTCSVCTDGDAVFSGNASASSPGVAKVNAVDPNNLGVGEGLSLKAETTGAASAVGHADGFFDAVGNIDLSNTGASDITVTFRLVWKLLADASIATANEDAFVTASVFVFAASPLFLVNEFVESDALFGPSGLQTLEGDSTFTLTVAAGETGFVQVSLFTEGFADALAVPEPGILPLLALGLAGLGFFARRRRR